MQTKLPEFFPYGEYSSSNYGVNSLAFEVGGITIYYSYKTPIAFRFGGGLVVRENDWSTTTGKHLNWIDGGNKKERISGEEFEKLLSKRMGLNTCAYCGDDMQTLIQAHHHTEEGKDVTTIQS